MLCEEGFLLRRVLVSVRQRRYASEWYRKAQYQKLLHVWQLEKEKYWKLLENELSTEQYWVHQPNLGGEMLLWYRAEFRRDSYRGVRGFFLFEMPIFSPFLSLFRVERVWFLRERIRSPRKRRWEQREMQSRLCRAQFRDWGQGSYSVIVEVLSYFARVGADASLFVAGRNSGCLICHPRYPT